MTKQSLKKQEFDEDYRPLSYRKTGLNKKRGVSHINITHKCSKWSLQENEKFLRFVQTNREFLLCPIKRKEHKIFLLLSKSIESRTPDQCRSHHQKMIKHHNDLDGIINHLNQRLLNFDILNAQKKEQSFMETHIQNKEKEEELPLMRTNVNLCVIEEKEVEENLWDVFNEEIWIQKQDWSKFDC